MQRFVTYIYAYENEEKKYNSGYAKIETRGNNGRLEIHLSNNSMIGRELKVAFVVLLNNKVDELPLGFLQAENGRVVFLFNTEAILNTDISFERVAGVKIVDADERLHMSFWKDIKLPETEPEIITENEKMQDKTEDIKGVKQEDSYAEVEQEVLHSMEIPVRNTFPIYTMDDAWRNLEKNKSALQLKDGVCAFKIELCDLRELPKKYWYLGNNSFLLHGFFNYHHLLFGKKQDGRWFIGVPGVYERQERIMASFFGFTEYLPEGVWYQTLEE